MSRRVRRDTILQSAILLKLSANLKRPPRKQGKESSGVIDGRGSSAS